MPTRARRLGTERIRKAKERFRGNAHQRGYTRKWREDSKRYIRRNPLCRTCSSEGRTVATAVVDHIRPHRGDQALFWDQDNWQPLCKRCHDIKTARGQ